MLKSQKYFRQGCLLTDQYLHDYEDCFVNKWDELIDWEKRAKNEGSFFYDILRDRNVQSILDVATGTGFHSVRFIEQGYKVVSVDEAPTCWYRPLKTPGTGAIS